MADVLAFASGSTIKEGTIVMNAWPNGTKQVYRGSEYAAAPQSTGVLVQRLDPRFDDTTYYTA